MDFSVEKVLSEKRGFLSPVVELVRFRNTDWVAKYYSKKNPIEIIAGGIIIQHEYNILKILQGIEGVVDAVKINQLTLLTRYIPGKDLAGFKQSELDDNIYYKLCDLLNSIHSRDVVHLDLRQRRNVIISKNAEPYIIDFASAIHIGKKSIFSWILEPLKFIDKSGLLKLKNRYFPHLVTNSDREFLRRYNSIRKLWLLKPLKLKQRDVAWKK